MYAILHELPFAVCIVNSAAPDSKIVAPKMATTTASAPAKRRVVLTEHSNSIVAFLILTASSDFLQIDILGVVTDRHRNKIPPAARAITYIEAYVHWRLRLQEKTKDKRFPLI